MGAVRLGRLISVVAQFDFHHTAADSMAVMNRDDLDLAAAMWAVHAYTMADIDAMLPRTIIPEGKHPQHTEAQ